MSYRLRVVVAPNAFKGSLGAVEATKAIEKGVLAAAPDSLVVCVPIADGGDGLTEVMIHCLRGVEVSCKVSDPILRSIVAEYCYVDSGKLAVIEMAKASGLVLVAGDGCDPTQTTTFGTGQLVAEAMGRGARKILLGLGGSATCDGGTGAAAALGFRFLDKYGNNLSPIGGNLGSIASIDMEKVDVRLKEVEIIGLCDVANPLVGPTGASPVYSPQKGANKEQVKQLDEGLENLAEVIGRELGQDVRQIPGAGAAGGFGAGIMAFLSGTLQSGTDAVLKSVHLEEKLEGADLVITAEGQMDEQTRFHKAPAGVGRLAMERGIPCIAVCGSVGTGIDQLRDVGIDAVLSICSGPQSLNFAMENGFDLVAKQTEQILRVFLAGRKGLKHGE